MSPNQLSVSELYEAVWHTPLKTLANRWQVHPHALGQVLDTYRIPRPQSGYWTLKALGKVVPIPTLPEDILPSRLIDITSLQSNKREKSKSRANTLPPPKKSLSHYALLKGIKGSLKKPDYQFEYILTQQYDNDHVMRLDVSAQQRDRAIAILHRILSAFEAKGWPVKVELPEYENRLKNVVTVDGVEIRFRLRERLKQQKRELTNKEREQQARNEWIWKENILVPTGILQLSIEGFMPRGIKSLFEDTGKLSLEEQLGTFVENLKINAEHSKILQEERKVREQMWREESLRRKQHQQAVQQEYERIQSFLGMFENWRRARECRDFINEVGKRLEAKAYPENKLEQWKVWAERVADNMDPLLSTLLEEQMIESNSVDNVIFEDALQRQRQV